MLGVLSSLEELHLETDLGPFPFHAHPHPAGGGLV